MAKIIETLKEKNIAVGWLYAYVHFITEVGCFYFLTKVAGDSLIVWLVPFAYDALAFVPQGIVGRFCDRFPKVNIGMIGTFLLALAVILQFGFSTSLMINLVILCLGNCALHIAGAESTLRNSEGKLAHSAIFVAGGSFGVITGKLLAQSMTPFWLIAIFIATMIPFIYLAKKYDTEKTYSPEACKPFQYASTKIAPFAIILIATFVVIVRGYMGYGIPTAWNKTTFQTILLFFIMGIGKALGGILADSFGIRKVALLSTVLAIPFLCFGDNLMIVSLIGVMFFSMTMAVTLGILVSVLPKTPGLAFGYTTIGLFLGTAPIFFVKTISVSFNIGMIVVLSLLCTVLLLSILKKKDE